MLSRPAAAVRQQRAVTAFDLMGDEAVAAAPALVSHLIRRGPEPTGSWDSADRATGALSGLGHRAIPSLRPALCDQHTRVRYLAMTALQMCAYDHAPGTITELLKLLDDARSEERRAGAEIDR